VVSGSDSPTVARLEEVGLNSWPALRQTLYDGWVLRFSGGYTKRANSVNPVYGSTLDPAEKIAHCEAVYAEQGLPAVFRLTPFSRPAELDRLLDERQYTVGRSAQVRTIALEEPAAAVAPAEPRGRLREESLAHWLETFCRLSGAEVADHDTHAAILEAITACRLLGSLEVAGRVVSCGVAVVEGTFCGLFDLVTDPELRRRGHGRDLTLALLDWARAHGARHGYLQVMEVNRAARSLYDRLGFREAYRYWYRFPAGSAE
jgi:ribosomal protein S18 acetylase RimI-like enzyme